MGLDFATWLGGQGFQIAGGILFSCFFPLGSVAENEEMMYVGMRMVAPPPAFWVTPATSCLSAHYRSQCHRAGKQLRVKAFQVTQDRVPWLAGAEVSSSNPSLAP